MKLLFMYFLPLNRVLEVKTSMISKHRSSTSIIDDENIEHVKHLCFQNNDHRY